MIIDNLQKPEIQAIGDVKHIKNSIDVENIDYITTLLSTNLYSYPIDAFLREIVSNAWDSHIAANNTDEPIVIKFTDNYIVIRDYGTGLSPKDFENIYCKFGTSTKRESNEYIGSFGIGKYASLAVSNIVEINNYYDGYCYSYILTKNNNTIVTTHINTIQTNQHNGLEISVRIDAPRSFIKKLNYLAFFPNIYVDYGPYKSKALLDFNNIIVTRYKHFSVTNALYDLNGGSYSGRSYALVGNVLYPLNIRELSLKDIKNDEIYKIERCHICLNIPIGSVDVTPNREELLYNEKTVECLNNALRNALDEIHSIVDDATKIDAKNIKEYFNFITSHEEYDLLLKRLNSRNTTTWGCDYNVAYKGVHRDEEFKNVVKSLDTFVPGFVAFYNPTKNHFIRTYNSNMYRYLTRKACTVYNDYFYALEDNIKLTKSVENFILDSDYSEAYMPIIRTMSKEDFIEEIGDTIYYVKDKPCFKEIAGDVYDWVMSNVTTIPLKEIEDWKKKNKKISNRSSFSLSKCILYKVEHTDRNLETHYHSENASFDDIIYLLSKDKVVLYQPTKFKDVKFDKIRLLVNLEYRVYWCNMQLYNAIVKYKKQNPNKLQNVIIDFEKILDCPDKNIETKLLIAKFKDKIISSGLVYSKFQNYMTDKEIFKYINDYVILGDTYNNGYFEDLTIEPKTPQGIWVKKELEKLFNIAKVYKSNYNEISDVLEYFPSEKYATHKTLEYCMQNNIWVNVNEYKKLFNEKLFKYIKK